MRDSFGNALGGIRLAEHAVATATNSGENTGGGFCFLTGWHEGFDKTKLKALYSTHAAYVSAVKATTETERQGRLHRESGWAENDRRSRTLRHREVIGMTQSGWHFLQIPGPTNVPDRVLRAMARPVIDHRGPEFAALTLELLAGLRAIFKTSGPVVIYPSSGSGASEAALVNTLSPGDRVLVFETGHFSLAWKKIAERLGLRVDYVPGNWRRGASDAELESRLAADTAHEIKAVVVVHNETSTGVASRIADLRRAMNRASHPALLIVDAVSSLASFDYRHDEWGVDVTVCGSQKGLMVPPGIGFVAVSEKARRAGKTATLPRAYWDWEEIIKQNEAGFFPYTPATNLFYGLREALLMLEEEGLPNIFRRHDAARRSDARGGARVGARDRLRGSARVLELDDGGLSCPRATTPTGCARSSSSTSTCRSASASRSSRAACSASATSAASTI